MATPNLPAPPVGEISTVRAPIVNLGGHMVFLGPLTVIIGAPPMRRLPKAPNPRIDLIGRAVLLERLATAFQTNQTLIVTGPAGVGKTALVLTHAADLQATGHYGAVFWVAPGPTATLGEALRALEIQALPDAPPLTNGDLMAEARRISDRLSRFVATDCQGTCLVVIDIETIADDAALQVVRGLLEAVPRQARHIVIARQAPTALRDGLRFPVPTLAIEDAIHLLRRCLSRPDDLSPRQLHRLAEVTNGLPQQIVEQAHQFNVFSEDQPYPADAIAHYLRALG